MLHPLFKGSIYPPAGDINLQTNLFAHYKCNDNAANTTVTDEKGTNGTASTNTSNLSTTGKINNAFEFNGSSEYIDCNQTFQTVFRGDFSVGMWVKPVDGQPAAAQYLLGHADAAFTTYLVAYLATSGKIVFDYRDGTNLARLLTDSAIFPDGATSLTHLLLTCDNSNAKLYVNGSEVALDATRDGDMSVVTKANYTNATNQVLGAVSTAGSISLYYAGLMDDVRLYSETVSQAKINAIYNSGSGTED